MKRSLSFLLALLLCGSLMAAPASAALYPEYPETEYAEISIPQEEIDRLAQRLEQANRTSGNTFNIINTTAAGLNELSTDYTVASLNAWNGVVTISTADQAILQDMLDEGGVAEASDAEKIAWALAWIHNNLVYSGYHTGTYVYSSFIEKGGQCNVYNGALGALFTYLGYQVQMIRGYRGSTGSESGHWWLELLTDGEPYVFECGNIEDGAWYYLGATYAETHGGDRDYIKSDCYAWSGEPYEYLGAAAYRLPADLEDGVTLSGRVKKGSSYTVSEVGLLLGESADSMQVLASEAVDSSFNTANEGKGFSMSYCLADCGFTPEPGKSYTYAFYVVVDGVTVQGNPGTFALAAPETPQEETEEPAEETAGAPWLVWLALGGGLLLLLAFFVLGGGGGGGKGRRKRRRKKGRPQETGKTVYKKRPKETVGAVPRW